MDEPSSSSSHGKELVKVPRDEDETSDKLVRKKRNKTVPHEDIYVRNLPSCPAYEKSYMHREFITHVLITKTQFLISASIDGIIKFWKKTTDGIEFVKSFKSHAGPVDDITVTSSGSELASISRRDKSAKVFDVVSFDMINMFSLDFEPNCIEWIDSATIGQENLIISDATKPVIYTYDSLQTSSEPKRVLNKLHNSIVCRMRYNPIHKIVISVDVDGHLEYWRHTQSGSGATRLQIENRIKDFQSEGDTDNPKNTIHNLSFAPNGELFATTSLDRRIRIYNFRTAKLLRIFDETIKTNEDRQRESPVMSHIDFARRLTIERELDKSNLTSQENAIFDESSNFIMFPSMSGVKIYNWKTSRLVRHIGDEETNFRPLYLTLFQGLVFEKTVRRIHTDNLDSGINDPTLFSTAFKRNRFYCFSNRNFEDDTTEAEGEVIKDRDVYNEQPTREEVMAAVEIERQQQQREVFEKATIHTTLGDIHVKLYPQYAPRACENFCTHARDNYYNNHIFHRVIKQFMIQTGDPLGTGTGGESIWGDDFEDEFCSELKHDKPYTLSMANCGPNTNGSQFFITVVPCPSLDNKHTIFGRVVKGMDVCQTISKVKTDPKTDKPFTDVKIINIKVS